MSLDAETQTRPTQIDLLVSRATPQHHKTIVRCAFLVTLTAR